MKNLKKQTKETLQVAAHHVISPTPTTFKTTLNVALQQMKCFICTLMHTELYWANASLTGFYAGSSDGVEKNKTDVAEVATFSLFTCLQEWTEHH